LATATAVKLAEGGVADDDIHAAALPDTMLDLVSEGGLRESLGRQRRRWTGFADQAHAAKARWGREYAAFCAIMGFGAVVQVVVRSPSAQVALGLLRGEHARQSARLSERLRYGRARFAPDLACDVIAAEICPASQDGELLDLHFHLAVRASARALAAMAAYFSRSGWSWWDPVSSQTDDRYRDPGMLAQYLGKGLAHVVGPSTRGCIFSPTNLAILHRQTRNLAMTRSAGAFRAWKAELERDGRIVAEDEAGVMVLRRRRPGHDKSGLRERLRTGAGPLLLRVCLHDFGDGLRRPALLVRGQAEISFSEIAEIYDLSAAIARAKTVMADLLKNTSNREYRSDPSLAKPQTEIRKARGVHSNPRAHTLL
jgi:hypothetical protein